MATLHGQKRREARARASLVGAGNVAFVSQPQTLRDLSASLDAIPDPLVIEGECAMETSIAIVFPDGFRAVLTGDEASKGSFVDALVARSEPAPFGKNDETLVDLAIRSGLRLTARGDLRIEGFDPVRSSVLQTVEDALSPRAKLDAVLTDVLVYPTGGRFRRHRDTPRENGMVGTLIVNIPIAHEGGALRLTDGEVTQVVDFAGTNATASLRWAAFHGDVDHEITEVRSGYRITCTYRLFLTGAPRSPSVDRTTAIRSALEAVVRDREVFAEAGVLLIPCARRVITARAAEENRAPKVYELSDLRGLDRDIAEAARELELSVVIRPCLAILESDGRKDPPSDLTEEPTEMVRLGRVVAEAAVGALGEMVTLAKKAKDDTGEPIDADSLASWVLRASDREVYVLRARAAATFLHEASFSSDGVFGNEHFDAFIYSFAAIEIAIGNLAERSLVTPPPSLGRVRHAKFGEGEILEEDLSKTDITLTIRFDDGVVRKLIARFVTRL